MNMNKNFILVGLLFVAFGSSAFAQQGPRSGFGPRPDMNMQFDEHNVSGWSLMNSEERRRHRERMMSSKNFDDCSMIQKEHYSQMQSRAKENNQDLSPPHYNACERMRERGLFN